MSSPIPVYVPVHRRNQSTSNSSRTPSPSPSSSESHTASHAYVYTPADLLSLAHSPLAQRSTVDMDARLRAVAPEVVQTRRQRKTLAWHAHHPTTPTGGRRHMPRHGSHSPHTSESEEDRASTWRRV